MTCITANKNNNVSHAMAKSQSDNVEENKGNEQRKQNFTSTKNSKYFNEDSSSCDVDSSTVEQSSEESEGKQSETLEESSGIEESDVGELMKGLRNAGYVPSSDNIARRTKEAIERYVIPFSKFVDQSNLPQDGVIAKVLKNQLKHYNKLDINGDTGDALGKFE